MGKEKVDPKSGQPTESPEPEKGLIAQLTEAVQGLVGEVKTLKEKQEEQEKQDEKKRDLLTLLFGDVGPKDG